MCAHVLAANLITAACVHTLGAGEETREREMLHAYVRVLFARELWAEAQPAGTHQSCSALPRDMKRGAGKLMQRHRGPKGLEQHFWN